MSNNFEIFCKTLNIIYLGKLSSNDTKKAKKIIYKIYHNNMKDVKHILPLFISYNYYFYKKPDKSSEKLLSGQYDWNKSNGSIAIPLKLEGVDEFEKNLLKSANKWFHHHIEIQGDYTNLKKYDISDKKVLYNLLDSVWRKKNLSKEEGLVIRKAIDGGGNAQFHPYKGWRLSGFGIWSHLRGLDFVLSKALPNILKAYSSVTKKKN